MYHQATLVELVQLGCTGITGVEFVAIAVNIDITALPGYINAFVSEDVGVQEPEEEEEGDDEIEEVEDPALDEAAAQLNDGDVDGDRPAKRAKLDDGTAAAAVDERVPEVETEGPVGEGAVEEERDGPDVTVAHAVCMYPVANNCWRFRNFIMAYKEQEPHTEFTRRVAYNMHSRAFTSAEELLGELLGKTGDTMDDGFGHLIFANPDKIGE